MTYPLKLNSVVVVPRCSSLFLSVQRVTWSNCQRTTGDFIANSCHDKIHFNPQNKLCLSQKMRPGSTLIHMNPKTNYAFPRKCTNVRPVHFIGVQDLTFHVSGWPYIWIKLTWLEFSPENAPMARFNLCVL